MRKLQNEITKIILHAKNNYDIIIITAKLIKIIYGKNVMKNKESKISIWKVIEVTLLSLVVVLIGIFFVAQKENLDIDEVFTYGLANNTFMLDIEDFKDYSGEDLLYKYAVVKDGEEFNISNVFFNQKMDTHPPLYYLLVNFICSIKKGTFSMLYGLLINLFFMVFVFFEMRYLFNLVIKDKLTSTFVSLIAFFTYGFINFVVFTRMYVMLTAICLAFIILIINKINYITANENVLNQNTEKNDLHFLIKFFALCVLGILTQYHFMFTAFFFSIIYAYHLIKNKNIRDLILTFITGILSILTSLLIFPAMINHMFGEGSLHALTNDKASGTFEMFIELLLTIHRSFFNVGFIPYLIILIFGIIICIVHISKLNKLPINYNSANNNTLNTNNITNNKSILSSKLKSIIVENKLFFILLLYSIFYYIIISMTVKYTFARYLYNIYPILIIIFIASIYLIYKSIHPYLKYLSIVVVIMLAATSRYNSVPFSLHRGDSLFEAYLNENKGTRILSLYRSVTENGHAVTGDTSKWKISRPVYTFRGMDKITFVDLAQYGDILMFNDDRFPKDDKLYLVIYPPENDTAIISSIMQNYKYSNYNKVYLSTNFNMYLLTRDN